MEKKYTLKNSVQKNIYGSFLFSDIVGSSKLWNMYPNEMNSNLIEHENRMKYFIDKYDGLVIKTIGDAFMAIFSSLDRAVYCAIDIQLDLIEYPILFSDQNELTLRIGIAHGPANERRVLYQNTCYLSDYYGTTVNMASRMESKVAKKSFNIAFCCNECQVPENFIESLVKYKYPLKYESYKETCKKERRRSMRLVSPYIESSCHDINLLKGVPPIDAYIIELSKIFQK